MFSQTRLINSVIHEHSGKIKYVIFVYQLFYGDQNVCKHCLLTRKRNCLKVAVSIRPFYCYDIYSANSVNSNKTIYELAVLWCNTTSIRNMVFRVCMWYFVYA